VGSLDETRHTNLTAAPYSYYLFILSLPWQSLNPHLLSKISYNVDFRFERSRKILFDSQIECRYWKIVRKLVGEEVSELENGRSTGDWVAGFGGRIAFFRYKLKQKGIHYSWETIRGIFANRVRITTSMKCKDHSTLYIRQSSELNEAQKEIYDALGIAYQAGKVVRRVL